MFVGKPYNNDNSSSGIWSIIYNYALSDANRAAVESYLMSKWGIT
jgi:hypothetical protein